MADLIIVAVVLVIVGFAARYIIKEKKRGRRCIGCPEGCCPSQKTGSCSCCGGSETK